MAIAIVCSLGNCHSVYARELLVGSWNTDSIRRYDIETNEYLGDFVPTGSGGLDVPDGMDFGTDGNLYVSSSSSNAILMFDGQDGSYLGEFSTDVNMPGNLQFGPDGMLYVGNKGTGEVLRFDPATRTREVFASGGGLQQPVGLLWDAGYLYVSDFSGNAIRRFDAHTGDPVDTFATISTPLILNHDPDGNLLVSSHQTNTIWEFDFDTSERVGPYLNGGAVRCPVGYLFVDGDLIVASWQNHRLLRYDDQGEFEGLMSIGSGLLTPNDLLLRPVPEPQGLFLLFAVVFVALRHRAVSCGTSRQIIGRGRPSPPWSFASSIAHD